MSFDISGPQVPAPGPFPGESPPAPLASYPQVDEVFEDEASPDVVSLLRRRRSVRHFLDIELAPALVEQVVQAAAWAPSGGNEQRWRVTALAPDVTVDFLGHYEPRAWAALVPKLHSVAKRRLGDDVKVEDAEAMVRELIDKDGAFKGRPWMLVVHYAPEFLPRSLWRLYARAVSHPIFGGNRLTALRDLWAVHGKINPQVDAHSVAMYLYALTLAATERELGSCIQYSPRAFSKRLKSVASIPRDHDVVGCVLLGYADETSPAVQHAEARAQRLPVPLSIVSE